MKARGDAVVAVDSATMVVSTPAAEARALEVSASSAYCQYARSATVERTATIAMETRSSQRVNQPLLARIPYVESPGWRSDILRVGQLLE